MQLDSLRWLVEKGKPPTVALSDPVVVKIDAVQYETGQGPCIDAIAEHETFRTGRLSAETGRWPAFAAAATDMGVESRCWRGGCSPPAPPSARSTSTPRSPTRSTRTPWCWGELLAVPAVALAGARRQATLRAALATRDLIATAKGILVERHHVDSHTTFQMLVKASQDTNMKLYDVAAWVIGETTGTAPPIPG